MGNEKRVHPRVKSDLELTVRHAETFHWTSLRNLSGGGVFVQTDTPQKVGSIVSMQLTLPVDGETMDIQGRVIWIGQAGGTDAPGMGIEFTSISQEHQQKIIKFVGDLLGVLGRST
jgi:uncharacterized protein (TIGR02266 family)